MLYRDICCCKMLLFISRTPVPEKSFYSVNVIYSNYIPINAMDLKFVNFQKVALVMLIYISYSTEKRNNSEMYCKTKYFYVENILDMGYIYKKIFRVNNFLQNISKILFQSQKRSRENGFCDIPNNAIFHIFLQNFKNKEATSSYNKQ